MTTLIPEKEFSRRSFVKGGGALIVGLSVIGAGVAGRGQAAAQDTRGVLAGPPDPTQVDSWLAIHADTTATVYPGLQELGNGTTTGLLQLAGEELSMDMSQLRLGVSDSNVTPNNVGQSASNGIKSGGPKLRAAAAGAYQALLGMASASLGVPVSSLSVSKGVVSGGGKTVSYGQLIGDKLFNVQLPATYGLTATTASPPAIGNGLGAGVAPTKPVSSYTLVTTRVPRIDIPAKVAGTYTYIHNVRVPGMLHGRVVRPRGQGAFGDAIVANVDGSSIKSIPGVQVVQVGNFVGVVAPKEYDAVQAAAQLKVTWQRPSNLPSSGDLYQHMLATPTNDFVTAQTGDMNAGFAQAAKVLSATYKSPYQTHGPIGPSCAVADVTSTNATVFVNSQGVYSTRTAVSKILQMPANQVRVRFFEGSSCFGASPYTDAAEAAALLSQQVGKPVRVQFMRWDEHGWDMYEPGHVGMVRAGIDSSGRIVAYDNHSWQHGWMTSSPERSQELAQGAAAPLVQSGSGSVQSATARNSGGFYATPNFRLINHQLPGLNAGMLKSSNMRSPLCLSAYFSSEGMVDELAHAANMDPVAFRTLNMGSDTGWQDVLNAAAAAANWKPKVSGSNLSSGTTVAGRGVALGSELTSYAAVVADITVNKQTGRITVNHLYGALQAGLTVNPGLVENQMVGLLMQGTSRATIEQLAFSKSNVTSLDWVSYPILRFKGAPAVTTVVLQRTDLQPTGAGEEVMCPVPAAIANAFFDATGVRIRQYPMTPELVRSTLKAAGSA